ncbi:MAG: DHHW family protein [Acetivibrionales bacterium]
MKKLKIDTMFFIIFIAVLGLANILNSNKHTVSNLENRALKTMPQFSLSNLFEGSFQRDFEEFYSDTFILRDNLVKISRDISKMMAFLGPDITIVASVEDVQLPPNAPEEANEAISYKSADSEDPKDTENSSESIDKGQPPSPTPAPEPEKDYGDDPNVGYWMVVDGKAVQLFKFNKESFDYYAQVLNRYSEKLGEGVKIYSMIPPTNGEFMQLRKYKGITDSQNDAFGYLKSKLDKSILTVDVFDALNKHKDEYIYFRTDHHWTALGAYYGYSAFMDAKGETPLSLDQYEKIDLGDFLGSSYTKTLDKSLEKNPDNIVAYKPLTNHEFTVYKGNEGTTADIIDLKYTDDISKKYLVFISSGGATWSKVKTDINNGKKILVVKDSFGNMLVPFLVPHYEEIYVVDSRFYNKNLTSKNIVEFIKDNGINEVVFCIYMEDVNWHKFMSGVENML